MFHSMQTGKSSIINSLVRRAVMPVYKGSTKSDGLTTTPYPHKISDMFKAKSQPVTFIDTPGISCEVPEGVKADEKISYAAKDMILRNRGKMEKIADPFPGVSYIIPRANAEDLMVHYGIPAFLAGDVKAFLTAVARVTGRFQKVKKTSNA
jgi:nuclear GTP-binding protein